MNLSAAPYLSDFRRRTGYSPFFRHVVTSALLAGLMVRFSGMIAPEYGIQATSWLLTFMYLYFALARASYVRTRCLISGERLSPDGIVRAERAFSIALQSRKRDLALTAGVCLLVGAAADRLLADVSNRDAVTNVIVTLGMVVWLAWCPRFLIASGAWAAEGHFSMRRGYSLARQARLRVWNGWFFAVLINAVVWLGALLVLYAPLRNFVLTLLPSMRVLFLFGAAFFGCVIAFQLTLQAAFAAWIVPELLRAESGAASTAASSAPETPSAPPPRAPPVRLFVFGGLLLPIFAYLAAALATAGGALAKPSILLVVAPTPVGFGLVLWAVVVTMIELPVAAIKSRAEPRARPFVLSGMRAGALAPLIGAAILILAKGAPAGFFIVIGVWCAFAGLIAGAATGYLYYRLTLSRFCRASCS